MRPFSQLVIPQTIFEEMVAHANCELPNECCGLLIGTIESGIATVSRCFPVRNDLASPTEYATNPRDMLDAMKAARAVGDDVLAIFHSHPSTEPIPSRKDLERNHWGESVVHVILGRADGQFELGVWWLLQSEFQPVEWTSSPG